ncbi:hypothetical protein BDK51DRAFT_46319 [Blyttiomyces helicus]|uniref:Uncharacterized protein n=1 Tax=Blyttiomyces helicus TaxID=388810 RepID=A0A4P9W9X6_9FUNG|nr:hypothetical protein BDK51DRAFT_46319 [Blyttiomyces helicus]|eukprot:RKO89002.1 hypothetical protein BDK51DRAFT_46319 [Blyttiomyces helicus]
MPSPTRPNLRTDSGHPAELPRLDWAVPLGERFDPQRAATATQSDGDASWDKWNYGGKRRKKSAQRPQTYRAKPLSDDLRAPQPTPRSFTPSPADSTPPLPRPAPLTRAPAPTHTLLLRLLSNPPPALVHANASAQVPPRMPRLHPRPADSHRVRRVRASYGAGCVLEGAAQGGGCGEVLAVCKVEGFGSVGEWGGGGGGRGCCWGC